MLKQVEEGSRESDEDVGTTTTVMRFCGEEIVDGGSLGKSKELRLSVLGKLDNGFDGVLPNGGELAEKVGKARFHRLDYMVVLLNFLPE